MPRKAKPHVHGRDHEHGGADTTLIHYEDVGDGGSGGGGGGIQFDTDPQAGGWLVITTTGNIGSGDDGVQLTAEDGDIEIIATGPTAADGNIFLAGQSGVSIDAQGDEGIVLSAQGDGDILIRAIGSLSAGVTIQVGGSGTHWLSIVGLPSSNPGGGNTVWRDASGFLRIG